MKVISKFKDFYDYLTSDYDADIIYVRNPRWVGDLRLRNKYMSASSIRWWKNESEKKLLYTDPVIRWNNHKLGEIEPGSVVFGVYPFIYSTPILKVYARQDCNGEVWRDPFVVYLGKNFIDNLSKETEIKAINKKVSELVTETILNFNKSSDTWSKITDTSLYYVAPYYKNRNILEEIKNFADKLECREVFDLLGSPVFVEENELIDFYHTAFPEKDKNKKDKKQYLVDLSFNELEPGIIKYWYTELCDLNTYNYIENFLWSQKHEEASEPTNNEKILNHGFDLKTSFRNVK